MVFMQHGLAVGMWMTAASLFGFWLLVSGALKPLCGIPMSPGPRPAPDDDPLQVRAPAIAFLHGRRDAVRDQVAKTALPLCCLIAVAPVYMFLRTTRLVDRHGRSTGLDSVFGAERAQSLETRLNAENLLTEQAMEQVVRLRPVEPARRPAPPDGPDEESGRRHAPRRHVGDQLGINGQSRPGRADDRRSCCPRCCFAARPARMVGTPDGGPRRGVAVLLTLYMIDNLLNAMLNPVFVSHRRAVRPGHAMAQPAAHVAHAAAEPQPDAMPRARRPAAGRYRRWPPRRGCLPTCPPARTPGAAGALDHLSRP